MSRTLVLGALLFANLLAFAAAEAAPGLAGDPAGTVVAVVDTGVSTLPGLRLAAGIDLVDGDSDPTDANGHGTAVAAELVETCPACTVLPVRVLSPAGTAPWGRVAAGVVWAVDHGAQIVNVSIAGSGGSPRLQAAVSYAQRHDVLVVAAAGNAADTRPAFPAAYPGVVGVAAEDPSGRLYDWSSHGSWVDLSAPGCATLPAGTTMDAACGTSFAAPLVSGIAALERASDPKADAAEIAARLPGLVASRRRGPTTQLTVAGSPAVGSVVRARATAGARGARVNWFRCAPAAGVHDCELVSASPTYRVSVSDVGSALVARLVTKPFGGLWIAASAPLAIS